MTQLREQTSSARLSGSELVGWIGTALVIGSYVLLSLGILQGDDFIYHSLVLAGSLGVALISYIRKVYQPFVINSFFVVIAIIAIIRLAYFV